MVKMTFTPPQLPKEQGLSPGCALRRADPFLLRNRSGSNGGDAMTPASRHYCGCARLKNMV